jgi:hypothetical protein
MRYHAAYMVFCGPEMKAALPSLAVTRLSPLPLQKKLLKWHTPAGEYAQVPMQRHDPFIRPHCLSGTNRYGLLSDTAEPFRDLALSEQNEHFLLYHPGQEQLAKKMY